MCLHICLYLSFIIIKAYGKTWRQMDVISDHITISKIRLMK